MTPGIVHVPEVVRLQANRGDHQLEPRDWRNRSYLHVVRRVRQRQVFRVNPYRAAPPQVVSSRAVHRFLLSRRRFGPQPLAHHLLHDGRFRHRDGGCTGDFHGNVRREGGFDDSDLPGCQVDIMRGIERKHMVEAIWWVLRPQLLHVADRSCGGCNRHKCQPLLIAPDLEPTRLSAPGRTFAKHGA